MDREATAIQYVQTVPVRISVDVQHVRPRRFNLEDEPVLQIRGVVDLSPDPTEPALPIWFLAEIQVYPNKTADILSFTPAYGSIQGPEKNRLMGIYEHAFWRSLRDTKLRIIGVKS
jgi:hypothetical protein